MPLRFQTPFLHLFDLPFFLFLILNNSFVKGRK